MARKKRRHRLEPTEHLSLHAKVQELNHTVAEIYSLMVERFGSSDKKAQRLRALDRKLAEFAALLAEQAKADTPKDGSRA